MPTALRMTRQRHQELPCWHIRYGDAELLIAEQGAQLLRYAREGEPPLVWLSEQAAFRQGQSVRGGVPLCWPWFGDLARNPDSVRAMHQAPATAPFHGLVRTLPWELLEVTDGSAGLGLVFHLPVSAAGLPGWPHAVQPRLRLHVGERLSVILSSHNQGDTPVTLSQALHSYLAVGDIRQAQVEGLDGCRYHETLEDWAARRQQGPLRFDGETDRPYLDVPERLAVIDPAWRRRLCLESIGSRSAIVWNPWIDKAARLSQFADDAWQRMLCIETANVLDDVVTLAPGAETRVGFSLWSEPLR